MMMMIMNCFCCMVDPQNVFSPMRLALISDTPLAGFEPAQKLSSGFVECSCAVVMTTTPRC